MADKLYFVHFSGENLGPISASLMRKMIQMGRLQGQDYAATSGGQWKKICDIDEFSGLFPSAPKGTAPKAEAAAPQAAAPAAKKTASVVEEAVEEVQAAPAHVKAAPKPAPAPAPKPAPKPEPKAEPKVEAKPIQGVVTIGKKMFKIVEVRQAGLLLEASGELEEGTEVQMQLSGQSFPKPFEMKAILVGKEAYQGMNVYLTEFVRPNPAHKRTLAAFIPGSEKE
jgi:hypothetical protein